MFQAEDDEVKILFCAALVGVALWWGHRWWTTRTRVDELGLVVAQAYEGEWTDRFGVTTEALHAALVDGGDAVLRRRIDQAVGVVDLRFDGGPAETVATTVVVTYDDDRRSTARLSLPWNDVPHTVRADLLRDGTDPVMRTWRAAE